MDNTISRLKSILQDGTKVLKRSRVSNVVKWCIVRFDNDGPEGWTISSGSTLEECIASYDKVMYSTG